ncbi:MAG TPA: hydroxymethylbilane synthase, partial [Balneola sp.]|nr:hydroxymethylbilane synthase [Balneola sp.]
MKLKIGTRRSKLALWQSNLVAEKLNALDVQTELVEIE